MALGWTLSHPRATSNPRPPAPAPNSVFWRRRWSGCWSRRTWRRHSILHILGSLLKSSIFLKIRILPCTFSFTASLHIILGMSPFCSLSKILVLVIILWGNKHRWLLLGNKWLHKWGGLKIKILGIRSKKLLLWDVGCGRGRILVLKIIVPSLPFSPSLSFSSPSLSLSFSLTFSRFLLCFFFLRLLRVSRAGTLTP